MRCLLLLVLVSGCAFDTTSLGPRDASFSDATVALDASVEDSSLIPDSSLPPSDTWVDSVDSGPTPTDAGTDAGVDSGQPDSGTGCTPRQTLCDGVCVETLTDLNHCGGCNQACSEEAADSCHSGTCLCNGNPPCMAGMCVPGLGCPF